MKTFPIKLKNRNLNKVYLSFLVLIFQIICNINTNAQIYKVDTFYMSNTPALTTNILTSVAVGKNDVIWIGSLNQGLYRFKYHDDSSFVKAPVLTNHAIRQITTDYDGRVYIGQSGSSGTNANNGGVDIFKDSTFTYTHLNALDAQPNNLKTRNVRSIYYSGINNSLFVSNSDDLTASAPRIGGMSIIKQISNPAYTVTKVAGNTLYNVDGVQMSAITGVSIGNSKEIWLAANRNCLTNGGCFSPRIMRFNLQGNYLNSYFDSTYSSGFLPFTNAASSPTVRAMAQDDNGLVWIGLSDGTIAIYNTLTNQWSSAFLSLILPANSSVNLNAIRVEGNRVYIGTINGLVIYEGGDVNSVYSYKVLTTSNGLSSNNITGISPDGWNDIWCSSSNGLMRIHEVNKYLSTYQVPYDDINSVGNFMPISSLSIAADSSKIIRFEALDVNLGIASKKIRIKEDTASIETEKFGFLELINNNGLTTAKYIYRSPIYFDKNIGNKQHFLIHIQVIDTITNIIHEERAIRIIRPPVIMLHGLWSDLSIWTQLKQKMATEGFYSYKQMLAFSYPAGDGFKANNSFIKNAISKFKNEIRDDHNISCGKVDLVGHSMGGILSRLYLQSDFYRNDVNKLISVNTPHSGSQLANLLTKVANQATIPLDSYSKNMFGEDGLNIINNIRISWTKFNPGNDAVRDLAVGSSQMTSNLNSSIRLSNTTKTAIHAIYTTSNPLLDWIPNSAPKKGLFKSLACMMHYSLNKRHPFNNYSSVVFNGGANDLIVSDSSQKGGLNSQYLSFIPNQQHAGSTENLFVMDTIQSLLTMSPLSNRFSYNGFTPYTTSSPFKPIKDEKFNIHKNQKTRLASTLNITSPLPGANYFSGDSVIITVVGSTDIEDIGFIYGGKSVDAFSQLKDSGNISNFKIKIPEEADGPYPMVAVGFNDSGLVIMDTLFLQINQNAILESIYVPNTIVTSVNDSTEIVLFGSYSDGVVRNISYNENINVVTNPTICTHTGKNIIKGNSVGLDTININYSGKNTTAIVEVISGSNIPLSINLRNLNATCEQSNNLITWSALNESPMCTMILQHSFNGIDFKNIYSTEAIGESGEERKYLYLHKLPNGSINYYRLIIADIDGNSTYSSTISVKNCTPSRFLVSPNPSNSIVNIMPSDMNEPYKVTIIDILGKIIYQNENYIKSGQKFDLHNYSSGIYNVIINTLSETFSIKIIKE